MASRESREEGKGWGQEVADEQGEREIKIKILGGLFKRLTGRVVLLTGGEFHLNAKQRGFHLKGG